MRAKILNASAGSGKTYQLAYKYVRDVVEQPALYRHILAVTFTNKATEEMKSRILKEIHLLASGGPLADGRGVEPQFASGPPKPGPAFCTTTRASRC